MLAICAGRRKVHRPGDLNAAQHDDADSADTRTGGHSLNYVLAKSEGPGRAPQMALAAVVLLAVVMGLASGSVQVAASVALCVFVAALSFFHLPAMERLVLWVYAGLPFVWAAAPLRPDAVNYGAAVTIAIVVTAVVSVLQSRHARPDAFPLFFLLVVVTGLVAYGIDDSIANYTWFMWPVAAVGLYYVVLLSKQDLVFAVKALLGLMVLQALIGLVQSFSERPVMAGISTLLTQSNRGYLGRVVPGLATQVHHGSGTFEHFNLYAAFLTFGVPLAFALCRARSTPIRWLMLVVLTGGVVTSYSRGALLASIIGCVFIYAFDRHSRKTWLAIGVAATITLTALGGQVIGDYEAETGNVSHRVVTWRYAAERAAEDPAMLVFGYGYRHFQEAVLQTSSGSRPAPGVQRSVHSSHLQALLETGVIGFLLLMAATIGNVIRAVRRSRAPLTIALSGSIVAFVIGQTVDNALFGYHAAALALLLALLIRSMSGRDEALAALFARGPDRIAVQADHFTTRAERP